MSNTAIQTNANRINVPDKADDRAPVFTPLADIVETNDAFIFQADLPGVKPGDLDVSYDNGVLTLKGRVSPRQPAEQNYVWREYGVGHFYRSFSIDTPVNVDGIRAELKNGVLELYVPKAESAKARKIEIQSA